MSILHLIPTVFSRQQIWLNDADSAEVNRIRGEIIDLRTKTANEYNNLLNALQTQWV